MGEPVTVVPTTRDFGGKTTEELEALLDNLTPDGDIPPDPAPEPPVEPVVPEPEPEPPAPVEPPAPEPEPEVDLAAHEREGERIKREALEAKVAFQEAHSARLAGEIGYLRKQLSSPPSASEPYQPQSQQEVDRLAELERRFAESESSRISAQVSQAVDASIGSLDGPWVQDLAKEIQQVAPKYADQIKAARETTDPVLARQLATGVALMVKAEATQMRWETQHADMVGRKEASTAANAKAKKAAAPSASGGVPAPPPKQRSYADMTAAEADAWLRENVR